MLGYIWVSPTDISLSSSCFETKTTPYVCPEKWEKKKELIFGEMCNMWAAWFVHFTKKSTILLYSLRSSHIAMRTTD